MWYRLHGNTLLWQSRDLKNKPSYIEDLIYNTLSLNSCRERATHHFIKTEIMLNPHLEKVIDWGSHISQWKFCLARGLWVSVCVSVCLSRFGCSHVGHLGYTLPKESTITYNSHLVTIVFLPTWPLCHLSLWFLMYTHSRWVFLA